jgi:hypothetical protein
METMKVTHGCIHTMEVPCGACHIIQKLCQRTQNIINVNKPNILDHQVK